MIIIDIKIKSIDDLVRCVNLSSLLELSGWPKPGNVHRTKNFENTRFEHFLAGITAIQPNFRELCEKIYDSTENNTLKFTTIELGLFYKKSVSEMMRWQSGGNVLLGHILILAPLVSAATICMKTNKVKIEEFELIVKNLIEDATVEDTLNLYDAIKICNPGGLGRIEKYDIYGENTYKEIKQEGITLKKIFELSKSYDLISSEYSSGFNIILKEGLPYFIETFNSSQDINIAIVNTYLKLLSNHLDTLIIRKSSKEDALEVSKTASDILSHGGISTKKGLELTIKFDINLHEKNGKMNPGTTADLVAGILFCALIFGLKF
ncbi:MAG: triphosphoribosyl-dephospho-CoA synthase [Candidatus Lokiarchaeota archaeon]|nr:triphosphoribosyl-dephospho-CoA synthase [Candidatus Lokiarchaeota archaeon]